MKSPAAPGKFAILLSAMFIFGLITVAWNALSSSEFSLKQVEWPNYPENAPLSLPDAVKLADLPLDRQNLVLFDLSVIEKRLLSHPWVKSVQLRKNLPETLLIEVKFKKPLAQLEGNAKNLIDYIDDDGSVFRATPDPFRTRDLLLFHGIHAQDTDKIGEMIKAASNIRKFSPALELSGVSWTEDKGYRALISYGGKVGGSMRTLIEMGERPDLDGEINLAMPRVQQVLDYLSVRSISPQSILLNDGKKIIVRIARRS